MANIFTSSFLGFIIGIISATAMAALFLAIIELPLNLIVRQELSNNIWYIVKFLINKFDVGNDSFHDIGRNLYWNEID